MCYKVAGSNPARSKFNSFINRNLQIKKFQDIRIKILQLSKLKEKPNYRIENFKRKLKFKLIQKVLSINECM